jgi:hypothetical protein
MLYTFNVNVAEGDEEAVRAVLAPRYGHSETKMVEQEVTIPAEQSGSGQEEIRMELVEVPNDVTLEEHM